LEDPDAISLPGIRPDDDDAQAAAELNGLADAVAESGPIPTIFCRNCRYPLDGIFSRECPECGQNFNPDVTVMVTRDPSRHRVRRFFLGLMWLGFGALGAYAGYGMLHGSFSMLAVFILVIWMALIVGLCLNPHVVVRRENGKRVIESAKPK